MTGFFDNKIEFLKGVGPQRAALLNKELNIFTYADLIQYYPFRYEDRTKFYKIAEIREDMPFIQLKGKIRYMETVGHARRQRLVAYFGDDTGEIQLVWFKGLQWILKKLRTNIDYVVFGKPGRIGRNINIAHPEIEVLTEKNEAGGYLQPVYSTTETLKNRYVDSKTISKLQRTLIGEAFRHIHETLPPNLVNQYSLLAKNLAIANIHYPEGQQMLQQATYRLKFEELFFIQLRLLKLKLTRQQKFRGIVFNNADLLTNFYNQHLPFELTGAQKRVIKEIYRDMRSGSQMNRLLQGDVGSGKTIVAFICMLIAIGHGSQAAIMAPTEILANQHYNGLKDYASKMKLDIALLTGSSKTAERKEIHEKLLNGSLHILVGTHALLEDVVQFENLGLAVIDEQHRFGVAQRAKLWRKNESTYPHMLVMTATPIPRTLAMTLYGDLDVSVIDELPAGRKAIKTMHHYDANRLKVFGFLKQQIEMGRQVYMVYPLIEESAKMDLKHLEDGYESVNRAFPDYAISIVHGKMKADAKEYEMDRFVKGETKIMVATTVIEVGVNVPNATVMVIENAERFGLAQLHQLRGRVGRGGDQSYCILMTDYKLSKEAKTRIKTMVSTTDGFVIADTDLKLRGPGDISGTQQSGLMDLSIADLGKDGQILQLARSAAEKILEEDPTLSLAKNKNIAAQIGRQKKSVVNWSRIS
ncbi:ATP-dependent DNA helicase RecG [Fulvivirgaceae bacterium BMA12]|uniref:ATP-dependent DNA helicase RecG n=1 Tax=Agaribacillus aureus TaxID=3051825 RepID=A0ABT8LD16_9BACT|nr:ATP-dependent DNA helicase RecG [Fulvivirgaceae bacterium BMA12]